jgi:hypothetical protein
VVLAPPKTLPSSVIAQPACCPANLTKYCCPELMEVAAKIMEKLARLEEFKDIERCIPKDEGEGFTPLKKNSQHIMRNPT